jgi:acyl transferase domain-containing protein/acyl carrier protein
MSYVQVSVDAQRQALIAIRKLRAKVDALQHAQTDPIAIVGMSCRFPGGVTDADGYWRFLHDGHDGVVSIPPERYDVDAVFDSDRQKAGTTYSRWAGLVDGIELFDEEFFGIAPREAAQTDPQQRLVLESAWLALEHAGIAPTRLRGSATGVFIGATSTEYAQLHQNDVAREDISAYSVQGLANSVIAGRVSHVLGLHGPSMSIDTACSSSLVAIDRACRSLREGESTLAIAGGVNVLAFSDPLIAGSRFGMFAADGRCKSFAAGADGFVRGEGCGVVVLKRLAQAQSDGDRILAVILGSAINHDGPSSGLTVPSGTAQQAVVRQALEAARIEPGEVGYIETHGTGTSLGDPIEAEALGAVFGGSRPAGRPLAIGAVKTNVGHLEAAAGVAGVIKVVLALQHGELPAQLHFDAPSPHIRWDKLELEVVDSHRVWEPIAGRRIAGVSSFGVSGTNAHIVIGEAPRTARAAVEHERPIEILSLSARSETALRELAAAYRARLEASPADWANVCHTAGVGRARFAQQLSVRAENDQALRAGLTAYLDGTPDARVVVSESSGVRPKIAFLFTGQGAQYVGMGRALYAGSSTVRRIFDEADALLGDRLGVPLGAVIRGEHPEAAQLLNQTLYTQPALYVLECALTALWRELGVEPAAVIGHSLGEYAAAAAGSVFSFADGLLLVADRARLMHEVIADGAMVVVNAPEAQVAPLLAGYADRVSVAAINAPNQVTLSGHRPAIEELTLACAQRGWRTVALPVSQAFHSPLLDEMAAAFETRASQLAYAPPNRTLVSNLTGAPIESVDAAYWRAHTRGAVRFADGIRAIDALGCDVLVELGPKPTLLPLAQQVLAPAERRRSVATLKGVGLDWDSIASAVQQLEAAGATIDWTGWDQDVSRRIVDVPSYPFERKRHWIVPSTRESRPRSRSTAAESSPLLGARVRSPLPETQFEAELMSGPETRWLADHHIGGAALVPATALIEMMLAAGAATDAELRVLTDVAILAPLLLDSGPPRVVQTIVEAPAGGTAAVRVFAGDDVDANGSGHFRLHAQGQLAVGGDMPAPEAVDLVAVRARCAGSRDADQHYARMAARGADFGPAFRGVSRLWIGESEALGEIEATVDAPSGRSARPHPALLDACIQVAGAMLGASGSTYVPFAVDRIESFTHHWPGTVFAHARFTKPDPHTPQLDLIIYDAAGNPLARAQTLTFKRFDAVAAETSDARYEVQWQLASSLARAPVAPDCDGHWLVLSDRAGIAAAVAASIGAGGGTCRVLPPGTPASEIAAAVDTASAPLRAIVDCRFVDADVVSLEASPGETAAALADIYAAALATLQAVVALEDPPPTILVTSDGAPIESQRSVPAYAMLSALRKSAAREHPDLRCRIVDLDGRDGIAAEPLLSELLANDEAEVALTSGRRFVPRLVRSRRTLPDVRADQLVELRPAASGVIEEVEYTVRERRAPQPHEVEIDVRATGLNFRDALNALAMLPGTPQKIGAECAGVVCRAGEASGFTVGEPVMAFAPGQSGSFVTVPACDAVAKPAAISFAQAAALPIVYMTALYAFDRVADLRPGETILIHAAAGGLGLAALHLALARGAIVYATAGSPQKREYVRALGAAHVMDSRSLGFADALLGLTCGRGVDVVLNALSGPFIDESFRALAPDGRFVEVGKRGILSADEAHALRPDVAYTVFDLGEEAARDPALVPALLAQTAQMIERAEVPPLPVSAHAYGDARFALADLAHARRIGKFVLLQRPKSPERTIPAGGTYIVTGGFGALGLQSAAWLAQRGAARIVLVGRHESDAAREAIRTLRANGVEIVEAIADCTDEAAMRAHVSATPNRAPLRGIIHCAGVLRDAILSDQSRASFDVVAAPKIAGTIALHRAVGNIDLDAFVVFSTAATTLGSAAQANYAAANAAMNELARVRRARGLPTTAVAWGPWSAGMADDDRVARRLDEIVSFDSQSGFAALDAVLADGPDDAVVIEVPAWDRFLAIRGEADDPFYGALVVRRDRQPSTAVPALGLTEALVAQGAAGRRRLMLEHVHRVAASVLGLTDGERINEIVPLQERGLDSLMSVELRNALAKTLQVKLSPTLAFDYPSIGQLSDHVLAQMFPSAAPAAPSHAATIAALSDAQAEALLIQELQVPNV